MAHSETYSIRQMIELTGLTEFTIRGWENRYSAFEPRRTATGRREYVKADVERALLLRELLKRGHKIGKIADLTNSKLKSLLGSGETEGPFASQAPKTSKEITKTLDFLAVQKWAELETLFQGLKFKSSRHFIHSFFVPLLRALGNQVAKGLVSVAQEHFLSSLLKEKLYSEISKQKAKTTPRGTRFVLATPEGDHHELGLLAAHLLIRSHGKTSLYLGANTPASEVSETALRFNASHILVVSTVGKQAGAAQETLTYLSDLRRQMGQTTKLFVAGPQAPPTPEPSTGISTLKNFHELEEFL